LAYYQRVSDLFANTYSDNANYSVTYGGLFVQCWNNNASRYVLTLDGSIFGQVTWYNFIGCHFPADWVFNIIGSGSVTFQGQVLPVIVERAILNIRGSGRTININTGIGGNILAPNNDLVMTNGVTLGLVVVRNVLQSVQYNMPNCQNFTSVVLSSVVVTSTPIGSSSIRTAGSNAMNLGDVCTTGTPGKKRQGDQTFTIVGATVDALGNVYLTIDPPLTAPLDPNTPFYTVVANPDTANRQDLTPNVTASSTVAPSTTSSMSVPITSMPSASAEESAASVLNFSLFALAALAFLYQ